MIKTLQDFFKSKSNSLRVDTVPSDHELKLAAASLMFETVRADGHIDEAELQRMTDALREQFSLSEDDVATMIERDDNFPPWSELMQEYAELRRRSGRPLADATRANQTADHGGLRA